MIHVRLEQGAALGGSPQVRQEFAESLRILLLAVPFSVYVFWALWMGIQPKLVLSTCVFFVGLLMVGALIRTGRHIEVLPWSAVLMIGALAFPATSLSPVLVLGMMIAVAGLISALILRSRLRSVISHGLAD
jgi:preprotein translocase subunit Sec61beta